MSRLFRLWPGFAALAAGLLAGLAPPPFGFWPGMLGYALLLWLVDRTDDPGPSRKAFTYGWLAGFGYFLIGCWWVAEAFLVDPEAHGWMAPFAATLLPAGLALFWGAACALYRKFAEPKLVRVLLFASVFSAFEWLRGHVLTGFPWNIPGSSWEAGSAPSQWAAWVGAYGLTWLTVFAFCAFEPLFHPGPRKARFGYAAAGAITLSLFWIAGSVRLMSAEIQNTRTIVRIVQADVDQEAKWSEENFRSIVRRYLNLTARAGLRQPDVVIWPEGALPASAQDTLGPGWVADGIAQALQPGQVLLMGTYRGDRGADGETRWYNSLVALHDRGDAVAVAAIYDKHRLVPFGEYLPLEKQVEKFGVKELVHVGDGFSPGPRPVTVKLPVGGTVQPLICYESLFPSLPGYKSRPDWIVNISNDAWFGRTSGPLQHLNLASYRAIEEGLPVIRSTPTGVSAVIDPYGRVSEDARLDSGESGVIDAAIPAKIEPTLYSRLRDVSFWALTFFGLAVALWSRRHDVKNA